MNARQRAKFEERFGPMDETCHDSSCFNMAYSAACQDEGEAVRVLVEALEQIEQRFSQSRTLTAKEADCYLIAAAALKAWKGE